MGVSKSSHGPRGRVCLQVRVIGLWVWIFVWKRFHVINWRGEVFMIGGHGWEGHRFGVNVGCAWLRSRADSHQDAAPFIRPAKGCAGWRSVSGLGRRGRACLHIHHTYGTLANIGGEGRGTGNLNSQNNVPPGGGCYLAPLAQATCW